jgi:hypothetical protein
MNARNVATPAFQILPPMTGVGRIRHSLLATLRLRYGYFDGKAMTFYRVQADNSQFPIRGFRVHCVLIPGTSFRPLHFCQKLPGHCAGFSTYKKVPL